MTLPPSVHLLIYSDASPFVLGVCNVPFYIAVVYTVSITPFYASMVRSSLPADPLSSFLF